MKIAATGAGIALVSLPAIALGFAPGAPAGKAGPPEVPYLCDGGRSAVVIYENGVGSRHARVQIALDGRTIELEQAPTLYGVRYRSMSEGGEPALAWSLRGEEAWLTEAPEDDSYTREERALARCIRLRGAAPEGAHGEGHGEEH